MEQKRSNFTGSLGFVLAASQWLTKRMDKKNKKKEAAK